MSLFQSPYDTGTSYDVFPKGTFDRFLFTDTRLAPGAPIAVVLNWQRLLDRDHVR